MATPTTTRDRDPLARTERLLVDGTNLLYQLGRRGPEGRLPAAALIGRLRAAIPGSITIELVFDGAPDPGMRGARVASGLTVRYAGRVSADALLRRLVDEERQRSGPEAVAGVLVVSDDLALRASLRERGARTAGAAWLIGRLERPALAAPSVGNRRPALGPGRPGDAADTPDRDRPGWSPGRGATTKRGNPRRRPSSGRMPS